MDNDGGEVVGDTKMAAATALTNGHVNDVGSSEDDSVIVKSVPKVTESFKSSENIGENSSDVERFKSKLTESSDRVGDCVTDTKQYEENALKAMSERTGNTEMSSTTETRLGQTDLVETSDSGAVKSKVREDQEKKHETASKTSEQVGDMSSTKEQSEKSHQRSSVTVDAASDGSHGVLVDLGNDTSSQSFEEIKGDGFRGTRKVENSRSERHMEYTSEGGAGGGGGGKPPVDMAMQMDELFDPRGEYTKKDRDKRSVSFLHEMDEMDRLQGGGSSRVMHDDMDGGYSSRRRGYPTEMDRFSTESYSSSTSSRLSSRSSSRKENSIDEGGDDRGKSSWGLSTDRRTADDLIKRVLAESRGKPLPPRSPVYRMQDEERPFSPSARYSPSSPRFDPGDELPLHRPMHPEEEPLTPTSPRREIFKVDMGDGKLKQSMVDVPLSMDDEDIRSSSSASSSQMRTESYESEHMAKEGNFVMALPRPKPRPQEEMSLLDRRLASLGFDTKLGQEMYVDKEGGGHEGYVETTYISKKKPPGFIREEDDDLDQEISALRSSYREGLQRRNRYMQDDYEDEEPMPVATQSRESSYRARGRMVRQDYIEGGDAFNYGMPPPPRPSENDEDFIPDEDFVPKKRPETEEVVKEKTSSIRTVVEKQSSVLEKLRDASNSFDELNSEIRNIKQQFMENQLKRNYLMTDDFERPEDVYPPTRGGGGGGGGYDTAYRAGGGYASRVANFDREYEEERRTGGSAALAGLTDDYQPYIPRKQRMAMQRSKSLFDDPYTVGGLEPMNGPQNPAQMSPGAGPDGTGRYEPIEDDEDEDALGYGGQPQRRAAQDYERAQQQQAGQQRWGYEPENDMQPSRRRSNYEYESARDDYEKPAGRKSYDYESASSGYSSTAARYLSRPTFTRANTLADFNFDKPSSPTFVRHDRYDRPSTFSSRFLDKVREKKAYGETPSASSTSRDKPFKSRFLRDSFNQDFTSSSSSSSISSSRFSRTSTSGASDAAATSGGASSSGAGDVTQDKTEGAPSAGASTEAAASAE